MRITDQHADQLRTRGYAIVPNFLTPEELQRAAQNVARYFPSDEERLATPERYGSILEDPEHLQIEFPFAGDALNDISTHPELISFAERMLETREVMLSQAAIWAKYAGTGDFEQGLHLDYQGNTLVVPRDDGAFRQINMILYYSDVNTDLGPTYVVPHDKTAHLPLWPTHRTRKKDPQLYKDERPILAQPGTLFIFSMKTWHRASAITAESGARFSHHFIWRGAAYNFAGFHLWSQLGENPDLQHFIARATPRQREVLGFPPPGHEYWNKETLTAVALRYPKMDMTPYKKALL